MGRYKSSCKEVVKRIQSSGEIFNEILETSTAKGKRSLENLRKMCDELEKRGVDLTISAIDREAKRLDIAPKEAALRNNPKLYTYVLCRQAETELKPKDKIIDEDLEELVKQLRRENLVLRSFIRKMEIK